MKKREWCITGSGQPYTIEGETFEAVVAVTLMLGGGALGLDPLTRKNDPKMPIFAVPESINAWVQSEFSMSHHQFMKMVTAPDRISDLARAAESVKLGLPGEGGRTGGRTPEARKNDLLFRASHLHKQIVKAYVRSMGKTTKH